MFLVNIFQNVMLALAASIFVQFLYFNQDKAKVFPNTVPI